MYYKIYRNGFKKEVDVSIKIFTCGDIVIKSNKDKILSDEIKKIISSADISICNFEGPIESEGKPIPKVGPYIKQHKETIKILKDQGFDLLLLANNHIIDYGKQGLQDTLDEAEKNSLETIGANIDFKKTYQPLIKIISEIKFGFLNACEAQFGQLISDDNKLGGYAWINHPIIDDMVVELKKEVDFIIFFAHAGLEYYEIPLIEWRNRYKRLCDLGVDCVIGSHPHIPQGYEKYNGKYIFYSLGNFYFPRSEKINEDEYGYSLILNFELGKELKPEIYFHVRKGYMIKRIAESESPIFFKVLNQKLENKVYQEIIKNVYREAYENICYQYYASVFNAVTENDDLTSIAKKIVKQLFLRNKNKVSRELLLLHLTRNETYQYITQRALEFKLLKMDDR